MKQRPELEGSELLAKLLKGSYVTVRKGLDQAKVLSSTDMESRLVAVLFGYSLKSLDPAYVGDAVLSAVMPAEAIPDEEDE